MPDLNHRYKVKGDAENFSELVSLTQAFTKVCVVNEKRHMISVDGMPDRLKKRLEQAGGHVSLERQHNPG